MTDLNDMRRKAEADALDALKRYVANRQRTLDFALRADPASKLARDAKRLLDKAREDYAAYARSIGIEVEGQRRGDDHETPLAVAPVASASGRTEQGGEGVRAEDAVVAKPVAPIADVDISPSTADDHETAHVDAPTMSDADGPDEGGNAHRIEQAVAAEPVAMIADAVEERVPSGEPANRPSDVLSAPFERRAGAEDKFITSLMQTASELKAALPPLSGQSSRPRLFGRGAENANPVQPSPAAAGTPAEPTHPRNSVHPLLSDPQLDVFDPWDNEESGVDAVDRSTTRTSGT
jgi:hypothetical protein